MLFQNITELSADVITSPSYPLRPVDYPGLAIQVALWMEINCLLVNWKLSKLYGRTPQEVTFSMTARQAKLSRLIARIVRLIGFRGDSTLKNNRPTTANLKRARVRSPKIPHKEAFVKTQLDWRLSPQIQVVCLWFGWRRRPYQESDRIHKRELIWDTGVGVGVGEGGVLDAKTDRLTVSYKVHWKWTKVFRVCDFSLPPRGTWDLPGCYAAQFDNYLAASVLGLV